MKKLMIVATTLPILLAVSSCSRSEGFFKLVRTGTPEQVQAAIDQGADVNLCVSYLPLLLLATGAGGCPLEGVL